MKRPDKDKLPRVFVKREGPYVVVITRDKQGFIESYVTYTPCQARRIQALIGWALEEKGGAS